ncbi:hypothetical protein IMZ48_00505 [Candidatus Bathyarchaeota archaeon]|nr:hypothetical protein [Candidatus Bathyarchaeota archaeon]
MQMMWFFVPTSGYGETFGICLKVWGVLMAVLGLEAFSYGVVLLGKNICVGRKGARGEVFSDVESQRSPLGAGEASGSSPSLSESGRQRRKGRPGRQFRVYWECGNHAIEMGGVKGVRG